MMNWLDAVCAIEEFEDVTFSEDLIHQMESAVKSRSLPPIRFSTPTFKDYASTELQLSLIHI